MHNICNNWGETRAFCQIGEAIAISESNPSKLMNSRGEWGTTAIPRVILKFPDDIPQADNMPETSGEEASPKTG